VILLALIVGLVILAAVAMYEFTDARPRKSRRRPPE
jgi:hypothetical protein